MNKNKLRRSLVTAGSCALMSLASMSAASAYFWGTLTVDNDGRAAGAGYGYLTGVFPNQAKLSPWLRDYVTDGHRTYARARVVGPGVFGGTQSDRRKDGASDWANMANKTFNTSGGRNGKVKVCLDKSFRIDPCSPWDEDQL
jgi:hypothetical protein